MIDLSYAQHVAKYKKIKSSVASVKLPKALHNDLSDTVRADFPGLAECLEHAETSLKLLMRLETGTVLPNTIGDLQTIAITQILYLRQTIEDAQEVTAVTQGNIVNNLNSVCLQGNTVHQSALSPESRTFQPLTRCYIPIPAEYFRNSSFGALVLMFTGICYVLDV
jgi:hypothetical protein